MLLHVFIGETEALDDIHGLRYIVLASFQCFIDHIQDKFDILVLELDPRCLGMIAHHTLELPDQSLGLAHARVFPEPFGEPRVRGDTLDNQRGCDTGGQTEVG